MLPAEASIQNSGPTDGGTVAPAQDKYLTGNPFKWRVCFTKGKKRRVL